MAKEQIAAAQQFSLWLSEACKAAREENGVNVQTVAGLADVVDITVKRFEEKGAGTAAGQPKLVAAYAQACGIADGRELYRAAVERWFQHTEPLTLEVLAAASAGAPHAGMPERPRFPSERADGSRRSQGR